MRSAFLLIALAATSCTGYQLGGAKPAVAGAVKNVTPRKKRG